MRSCLIILSFGFSLLAAAQPHSQRLALRAMQIWPDSFLLEQDKTAKWRYDQGVVLKGVEQVWLATGEGKWFEYIRRSMDFYVSDNGAVKGYKPDEYNIDHINNGKLLLTLYRVTGRDKYKKAADALRRQLITHPRTSAGGFWHKNIYPHQMWLDGLYMAQPFYAEYAQLFHEDSAFNDIARQFVLIEQYARDPKTGLLYHGWDESREQRWADKTTGRSPHVWARSLGWFGMALVDVLDYFPAQHPRRAELLRILRRFVVAVRKVQDPATGLWYDIPDLPQRKGNYPEASASCMLAYTFAKASRLGYIPADYAADAALAYRGILQTFVEEAPGGAINLKGTVAVSGLGGKPYRDGSFEYYMSEPVVVNDPKGMGAFILCAAEMEMQAQLTTGIGKTILLDTYFNNEWKNDATGRQVRWHYTWDDRSNGGFHFLGHLFQRNGARLQSLSAAPTAASLAHAGVYILVDPDTEKETANPNYMEQAHVQAISRWVRNGGVLVMMTNDAGNCELERFNLLSSAFGIRFNTDQVNMVKQDRFEEGAVLVPHGHTIFPTASRLFIKELSSIEATAPAIPVIQQGGKTIMAVSRLGRGWVFAVGDPWLYNEYVDGRKLPAEYDNYPAARDLVRWLLERAPVRGGKRK